MYSLDICRQLAETNPSALVNQFPYESTITVKDLFAAAVQTCGRDPMMLEERIRWYPTTFNLNYELPAFAAYFLQREAR